MSQKTATVLVAFGITVLTWTSAIAEQIVKPNTFSAGTPANAEEVNANFDTVYDQVNKVGSQVNIDTANGRVGIGTATPSAKLDVQGGVKIGDSSSCDATTEGTLRYNTGEMQYCNGTSWKSFETKTPIIWSGGCSSHGRLVGQYQNYCTDIVDFNTASTYLSINPNGNITFLKSGYYRVDFQTISFGTTTILGKFSKNGSAILQLEKDGATGWNPIKMDRVFSFNAGDVLLVSVSATGGSNVYTYHQFNATSGAFGGLQISYEGPLN